MNEDKLLCCDWGTSNFRIYLVNINSQEIIGKVTADKGVADLNGMFDLQSTLTRIEYFTSFLSDQIQRLAENLSVDLTNTPVLLSGMASSSIGMIEIPYAALPFSLEAPKLNFEKISDTALCPNDLFVFGGIKSKTDVMRGEEVQLLGLRQTIGSEVCICILPGTHSKHISIENKMAVDFKTYMTGELFQLLSEQSILKNAVLPSDSMTNDDRIFFEQGVMDGAKNNLLHSLFKVRTNKLLHQIDSTHNYFYLSGLLIGHELNSLKESKIDIYLSGASSLAIYYQLAFQVLELDKRLTIVSQEQMKLSIPKAHTFLFNCLHP